MSAATILTFVDEDYRVGTMPTTAFLIGLLFDLVGVYWCRVHELRGVAFAARVFFSSAY
jgi:hypothetical protein